MDERTQSLYRAWWRLARLPGVGTVTLSELRQNLQSPYDLPDQGVDLLAAAGLNPAACERWLHDASLDQGFDVLLNWCLQPGQGVLLAGMDHYPEALAALSDAPTFLYWRGQLALLDMPCVAIVGSRNPTPYARDWAFQCGRDLAAAGVCVVSGLALGIDGAAHEGALSTGTTIAVLGCGADVAYPKRHNNLMQRIAHQGLLLSEFAPGTQPLAAHFPARNRIVSGLCQAVVVAEAAVKSGSLITARLAASQGRDVMALPGAVTNPLSHGCHQLIRDGALLVQNASEVLEGVGIFQLSVTHAPDSVVCMPVPELVTLVDYQGTSVDVLAIRSGLAIAQLLPRLMEYELDGWLQKQAGGYRRLR
ncbi:DNA-processing protein DprA [Parathalassolituus penaei]|uniref:DNA-processing protein DprA n=1 Tax=Parathalassolituus penaei TaxID=2997323 RepID=A0A9X3ECW4_9GAMM|nr:DNA-processing protein DprA [Parathalassolituus penaei]MCY0965283.1 DNA-processing protein DprA [Parathalassolituus penaei]